jgi:hypothetical protein
MPATIPESERLLPSPERLEILDHLMGAYLSELDSIGRRVTRELTSEDLAERFAAMDAGVELPEPAHDRAELLELLRISAIAVQDANSIREIWGELQRLVLSELAVTSDRRDPDDPAWVACRQRIRAWHAERAEVEHDA